MKNCKRVSHQNIDVCKDPMDLRTFIVVNILCFFQHFPRSESRIKCFGMRECVVAHKKITRKTVFS